MEDLLQEEAGPPHAPLPWSLQRPRAIHRNAGKGEGEGWLPEEFSYLTVGDELEHGRAGEPPRWRWG
jgi:hypothetical protein